MICRTVPNRFKLGFMKFKENVAWLWKNYRAPILWAAVLFIQSSIPDFDPPMRLTDWDDKWAHLLIYMPLGFLLMRALAQTQTGTSTTFLFFLATGIGALYGIFDEVHQHFVPGRHMDWRDAVADGFGVVLGSWLYLKVRRRLALRTAKIPEPLKEISNG